MKSPFKYEIIEEKEMARDNNFGFEYDERGNVPTFEEVSSVMRNKKKNKHRVQKPKKIISEKPKNAKSQKDQSPKGKKAFFTTLGAILLLALIAAGGYGAYKYNDVITSNVGKITGNFAIVPEDKRNALEFPFKVTEVPIDLQEEEDALVLTLGQNCESQKGAVASDIRKQKDAECENKLNPIEIALEKAEEDAKDWESKYDSCKEDLDACEDG